MGLDEKDLQAIQTIVDKSIDRSLKAFKVVMDTSIDDKLRNQSDLLRQEIKASEAKTDKKLDAVKEEILTGVAEAVEIGITPQLEDHDKRLTKLEAKLA